MYIAYFRQKHEIDFISLYDLNSDLHINTFFEWNIFVGHPEVNLLQL